MAANYKKANNLAQGEPREDHELNTLDHWTAENLPEGLF